MRAERPFVDAPAGAVDELAPAAYVAASKFRVGPPTLLRVGMNGIFVAGDTVLRVSRPTADGGAALALARTLRAHGVRVPAPARDDVVEHDGLTVTAWELVRPTTRDIDWHAVGRQVRTVHEIATDAVPPSVPLPSPASFPWWDFEALLADVDDLLDAGARAGIRRVVEQHAGWRDLLEGESVVCHGDVHPGNVIQAAGGPVLLDWDLLCLAPPAWDHAMMMTSAERWGGRPGEYDEFAAGIGWSGRGDPAGEAFAALRLVAATLLRLRAGRSDASALAEAERRLRFWRGDPDAPPWRAQ